MLQVKSNLRLICFQTRSICFNLGQFDFCFFVLFCSKQKKIFFNLQSSLHPPYSLRLHSTYLIYYSLPTLPTSQPSSFYLNAYMYLVRLEPQTFCFLSDSWTNVLPVSHGYLDASSAILLIT